MNTMKDWKLRYRDMGSLFWVVLVILLLGVTTEVYCVADIFRQAEPDKALAGIYGLNALCLTFVCVQVLRLDCRNLLARRTVRISAISSSPTSRRAARARRSPVCVRTACASSCSPETALKLPAP